MTVREFYERIHGDYYEIFSRFPSDALILCFVQQFPSDASYEELITAVKAMDPEACFAAAHKLKGIAANLAFSELYTMLQELSEDLRPRTKPADAALLQRIGESYHSILREIDRLENGECRS